MQWRGGGIWLAGVAGLVGVVCGATGAGAQIALPEVVITAPSPILSGRSPADAGSGPAEPALLGTLPIVTDQFATVTVVPNEELRRNGASTLGDLLNDKPGITGSGFAPGASSRPIIRGLDVNRVRMQEDGIGANGASDLGEDHFVPVDPLTADRVEVIRGPATLRFGTQAIGGVVDVSNNRVPTDIPARGISAEFRGGASSADNGLDGAVLFDAGAGNVAMHADAFGRSAGDYRVPHYPYLTAPDPAEFANATQPGNFNGRQPNSSYRTNGQSIGGSYIFDGGFIGMAVMQNNALYRIPGIEAENGDTRIDATQTKLLSKGEWRAPSSAVDAVRFWLGVTDYKHNELGLADSADPASDGIRQTFTNKEQEGRVEVQLAPFDLRFAALTTAIGVSGGHQELTAPSPDGPGLWDPNRNWRAAGYIFNEFRFSDRTKAQLAARIEHVDLSGTGRVIDAGGNITARAAVRSFTPVSVSAGVIQNLPWDLVASVTGQYVERAPKPAELYSGGVHDATGTFDKGNVNLGIESAQSLELGLRRATGPFRFELTGYVTRFNGFIYRRLTGDACDEDGVCGTGPEELNEAVYSQANATFRGVEFQSQWDLLPLGGGQFGVESRFDVVRATFADGSNVPRIPPVRLGGGVYWRDANWLAKVNLLHAWAQNDVAASETATPGYNNLRAELSYTWKKAQPAFNAPSEVSLGIVGTNLLNDGIRNAASYSKDQVPMPGASLRVFARLKY
jgi:iron complex outermembrane receptor protein